MGLKLMIKRQVLFLCTGNSCRSQMAEALVNHDLGQDWLAFSAGTHPMEAIHPLTVRALAEIGIAHHGVPKSADAFRDYSFDLVITVCDEAAENCPVWLGRGAKAHIGFPDPAQAPGTDEEKIVVFRAVRDDIRNKVIPFLKDHPAS